MNLYKTLLRAALQDKLAHSSDKINAFFDGWIDQASDEDVLGMLSMIDEDVDLAIVDGQAVRI